MILRVKFMSFHSSSRLMILVEEWISATTNLVAIAFTRATSWKYSWLRVMLYFTLISTKHNLNWTKILHISSSALKPPFLRDQLIALRVFPFTDVASNFELSRHFFPPRISSSHQTPQATKSEDNAWNKTSMLFSRYGLSELFPRTLTIHLKFIPNMILVRNKLAKKSNL